MSSATLPMSTDVRGTAFQAGSRLGPMVVLLAAYWLFFVAIGYVDVNPFLKAMLRLGALAITLLGFTGWWLLNQRLSFASRSLVLVVATIAAATTLALRHASISGPLALSVVTHSVEAMLTGWVAWLVATRHAPAALCRTGMMAIAVVAWAWGLGVRADGMNGDGAVPFFPRWVASAEEKFLAANKGPGASLPAAASVSTPDEDEAPVLDGAWAEFRGSARNGAVHGVKIATNWDETPPKQIWKRRVGPGWSSIVIVGDALYTQEQIGDDEAVVCYEAATGEPRWTHRDPGRFDEAMGGLGPRATPTFVDGKLYTLGATGTLNCLNAATGDVVWSHNISADGQQKTPYWGFCSSPLVVGGKVIVYAGGGGSFSGEGEEKEAADADAKAKAETEATEKPKYQDALLAYDAASGDLAWRAPAGSHSYSSAQVAEFDGQPQVLFVGDDALVSVNPADGAVLWSLPTNGRDGAPAIQPHLLGDGEFLVSFTSDTGLVRGKVSRDDGKWSVETKWVSRDLKPFFSDFVRVGDTVYGFDGSIFCSVDATTGKRNWKKGRYGSGQVLLAADQPVMVVITESGELVLVAANPEKHEELGRFQAIEGKTWNHPTIVGHRLYVRNAEEMACYELK